VIQAVLDISATICVRKQRIVAQAQIDAEGRERKKAHGFRALADNSRKVRSMRLVGTRKDN
jgi:hypothetical protein